MKDKWRKKLETPEDVSEDEWASDVTIGSHMSYLTNKRLHDLFVARDEASVQAGTSYDKGSIMAYGSILDSIYKEIEAIIDEDKRKRLWILFNRYKLIRNKDINTIKERAEMFEILSYAHRLMNMYMQQFNYFFRLEQQPIKGLHRALEKVGWISKQKMAKVEMDEDGLPRMATDEHEPDGEDDT